VTVISRTNLCANPSFEASTTGWAAGGANPPTISRTQAFETYLGNVITFASTPDNAALDITGDIDIRAEIMLFSTPNTASIITKGFYTGGTQQSYELLLGFTAGVPHVTLRWSTTGSDLLFVDNNQPQIQIGTRIAIRVTMDVDDGAGHRVIKFYTAPDINQTFVLTDTYTVAGTTSIFSGTSAVRIGRGILDEDHYYGNIYAVQVLNGIAGTAVANPDFTAQVTGATSFTDAAGRVWTVDPNAIMSDWHAPGAGTIAAKITWRTATIANLSLVANTFTAVNGSVYTISAWVYVPTGSPRVFFLVSAGGSGFGGASSAFDQWTQIKYTFTATGTSVTVQIWPSLAQTAGQYFYLDAVLFEQTGTLLPFFDGDTTGATWNGTPDLSTSTLTAFDTAPSLPLTVIEFDATAPQATDFILNKSLLDGTMVLVPKPRYVNVANQGDIVNSAVIQRGRMDPNGDLAPGFATLNCDNFTGSFDPENLNSPFNQTPGDPSLVKGMLCRISALFSSGGAFTTAVLFTGRLEDVALRKELQPDATLHFVDDLAIYGTTTMPMFNNSIRKAEVTLSRARWLATIGGLAGATAPPIFSRNLTRAMVPTYGGGQVLDEIQDLAAAEVGRVWVDRVGVLNVTAHADEFLAPVVGTLSDNAAVPGVEYSEIVMSSGTMQISNAVRVRRYSQDSNYPDIFAADLDSIGKYGQIQVNGVVGYKAPLFFDSEVQQLAVYLAHRRSRPAPRIDAVTVDFTGNSAAAVLLDVDIGNQVVVSRTVPYISHPVTTTIQLNVEGIQWSMDPDTFKLMLVTSTTDSASLLGGGSVFILDSSLLDSTDVLSTF
jgi:hypothetical protein